MKILDPLVAACINEIEESNKIVNNLSPLLKEDSYFQYAYNSIRGKAKWITTVKGEIFDVEKLFHAPYYNNKLLELDSFDLGLILFELQRRKRKLNDLQFIQISENTWPSQFISILEL